MKSCPSTSSKKIFSRFTDHRPSGFACLLIFPARITGDRPGPSATYSRKAAYVLSLSRGLRFNANALALVAGSPSCSGRRGEPDPKGGFPLSDCSVLILALIIL